MGIVYVAGPCAGCRAMCVFADQEHSKLSLDYVLHLTARCSRRRINARTKARDLPSASMPKVLYFQTVLYTSPSF